MVRPGTGGSSPDGPRFSGSAVPAKTRLLPQDRPEQAEKPAEKATQNNRNSPQGSRRSISRKPQRADIRPLFFGSLARRWAGVPFFVPPVAVLGSRSDWWGDLDLPSSGAGTPVPGTLRPGPSDSPPPRGTVLISPAASWPGQLSRKRTPAVPPLTAARCPRYGRTGYPGTRRWPGAGYRRRSCGPPPECSPG